MTRARLGGYKKKLAALTLVLAAPVAAHFVLGDVSRIDPPRRLEDAPAVSPPAYTRTVGALRIAYLAGTPERIGGDHARILRQSMIDDERALWEGFDKAVPSRLARTAIFDLGRFRYRHVDDNAPPERLREIAAQAEAFQPDPFDDKLSTYHRLLLL